MAFDFTITATTGLAESDRLIRDIGAIIPGTGGQTLSFTHPRLVAAFCASADLRDVLRETFNPGGGAVVKWALSINTALIGTNTAKTQVPGEELDTVLNGLVRPAGEDFGASSNTTSGSTTDVAISSLSTTLGPGKFLITWSGTVGNSGANNDTFTSIYSNGAQQANTERKSDTLVTNYRVIHSAACFLDLTAAVTVEIRWRTTGGTMTAERRQMSTFFLGYSSAA